MVRWICVNLRYLRFLRTMRWIWVDLGNLWTFLRWKIPNSELNQRLLTELVPGALLQGLLDSLEGVFVACLLE